MYTQHMCRSEGNLGYQHLLFGIGSFTRLDLFHIGQVSWPLSLKDSACLSLPFYRCWDYRLMSPHLAFFVGSGN